MKISSPASMAPDHILTDVGNTSLMRMYRENDAQYDAVEIFNHIGDLDS